MAEENSGALGSNSGEPVFVDDEVHDPWLEDLDASGEILASDNATSALDLAMFAMSAIFSSCWRNEARAAVREQGWVPKDCVRLRDRGTISAFPRSLSAVLGWAKKQ